MVLVLESMKAMCHRLLTATILLTTAAFSSQNAQAQPAVNGDVVIGAAEGGPGGSVLLHMTFDKNGLSITDLDFTSSVVAVSPPLSFGSQAALDAVCPDPALFNGVGQPTGNCNVNSAGDVVIVSLAQNGNDVIPDDVIGSLPIDIASDAVPGAYWIDAEIVASQPNPTVATDGNVTVNDLDTDGDGDPDVTDPDDDNDGIGDVYDRDPLDDSNAECTTNDGTNATLVGATISAQQTTCASKESVDVSGTTNVGIDGDLLLISEKVSLTDTSVTDNGRMEVINADPCPGCVFPPAFFQFGVPVADYQALFNQLVANGYRPVWLDGYRSGGQSFINAIFDKTQVASWASAHGQNGAAFQAFLNDQTLAGHTLVHVDSYRQGNDIVYASIFVDQPGPPWIAYSGLTGAQHQAQFNNLLGLGYRASIISVVEDSNGVARYTGLYDQSNVGGWVALANLTSAQYNAEFVNQANAGRALAYLNGYTINGSPRFTAIWNSNVPNSWVSVHDRTSAQFQSDFDLWTGQGLLTRIVTGYDNGGTANFAGLWTD